MGRISLLIGRMNFLIIDWIGGTIPYFMTSQGGVIDRDRVFVNELPFGLQFRGARRYGPNEIHRVYADLPADGFGVAILPASSPVHLAFAVGAPSYDQFAVRPLVGWVSGVSGVAGAGRPEAACGSASSPRTAG